MILERRKKYLQIALNSDLIEAGKIIRNLPFSDQIIIEAGTPLIKTCGVRAISRIKEIALERFSNEEIKREYIKTFPSLMKFLVAGNSTSRQTMIDYLAKKGKSSSFEPYVVADIKCNDLARKEIAIISGVQAATCLGVAPIETIDSFIEECKHSHIDSMIDMMNVENPLLVLKKLKQAPDVVILHRGVDETEIDKEKQIPYYQIRQIKGNYNVLVSIAGGDTIEEVERAFFNDADIVVVWKSFYRSTEETAKLAQRFYEKLKISVVSTA